MKKVFLISLLIGNVAWAFNDKHTYIGKIVVSNGNITVLDNGKTITEGYAQGHPVGCELVKYTWHTANPLWAFSSLGLSLVLPNTKYYCKNQSAVN